MNRDSQESNDLERKVTVWRCRGLVAWSLIGFSILLFVFGVVLNVLAIPVGIMIWALIIVFCLRGQVGRMERHGISRAAGTSIAYAGMLFAFVLVIALMFSPIFGVVDQFQNLSASIPAYTEQVSHFAEGLYQQYPQVMQDPTVTSWISEAQNSFSSWVKDFAKNSLDGLIDVGTVTANTFICMGFALVVAFWLLLELPAIGREAERLAGGKRADDMRFLYITLTRVMGGYIKGTLLQCGIIAVACIIAFSIMGVPNAVALGIITGLLNIIPIVGPWFGGALAAIAALFASPLIAVLALVATIVIQQVVYTFISPKIMANSVDVHPALVIMAMMIGSAVGFAMSGMVGSLVGMLLSIPLAAVGKAAFVYYFEKRTGRHLVAVDGVFFKGVPSDDDTPNPEKDATSPHPEMLAARLKADAREAARKAGEASARARRSESGTFHKKK
jgi:predicted PurR-regulated permease PerM